MPFEIDYIPFATGVGANVYSPATYQALGVIAAGVEPGLADGQLYNTTARLSSMMSAALANYISQQLGINVLDDGNLTNLVTNLTSAIGVGSKVTAGRIITSSANFTALTTDYYLGMNRTAGVTPTTITFPASQTNQEYRVDDLAGNFQGVNQVTLAVPGGHSIQGGAQWVMNVNRQSAIIHYAGSTFWSVK
jgi:hypothetical protein